MVASALRHGVTMLKETAISRSLARSLSLREREPDDVAVAAGALAEEEAVQPAEEDEPGEEAVVGRLHPPRPQPRDVHVRQLERRHRREQALEPRTVVPAVEEVL